jgi:hypothetical protein
VLSLILYGRNDSYGYNLHKRAAISLNCMTEVLTDPNDEVIFVDYNTPDDYPTFPEAIQDTLTEKCKRHLRILRARPSLHARFAHKTHLLALEPVSRNIALRRSNPENRWILSTNTDMVFVPRSGNSLTDIVRDLPVGHYGIPRFEVPETLWEGVNRSDPRDIIASFSRWGWTLHLNEIVAGLPPFLFDGPGDFQLMLRDDLFKIGGFHEEMLLGWHVDANIAKRMSLIHGNVSDLTEAVFGYHCDHTRQVTPAHRGNAVQNDMRRFFLDVDRPDIPENPDGWGCPDVDIEEIRLDRKAQWDFATGLESVIGLPLETPTISSYTPEQWAKNGYDPRHVMPFLADLMYTLRRDSRIVWIGANKLSLRLFHDIWSGMGFAAPILLPNDQPHLIGAEPIPGLQSAPLVEALAAADMLVFDFSGEDGAPIPLSDGDVENSLTAALVGALLRAMAEERVRVNDGLPARRFIGINTLNNQFDSQFNSMISVSRSPFSARVRHGFVNVPDTKKPTALLSSLQLGSAARRVDNVIETVPGESGNICYGPYTHLFPARYKLTLALDDQSTDTAPRASRPVRLIKRLMSRPPESVPAIHLEIVRNETVFLGHDLVGWGPLPKSIEIFFDLEIPRTFGKDSSGLQLRCYTNGLRNFRLTRTDIVQVRADGPIGQPFVMTY